VPDLSQQSLTALDDEFRQLLTDNGYDVTQLGIIHPTQHTEELAADTKR
jgi:hypothetical protein